MKNLGSLGFIVILLFCVAWACKKDDNARNTSTASPSPTAAPSPAPTAAPGEIPARTGLVTDAMGLLDDDEKSEIEALLAELRQKEKVDFAILIVGSTGKIDPKEYARKVRKEWTFGAENGTGIFVAAIDDRVWRIQIDEKLQKKLTDPDIKEIGDSVVPDFKKRDYTEGLKKVIGKLTDKLAEN
jgi:uncharacterized membrane protein YgcG